MKIVAISGSQVPSNVANSLQTMKAVHALARLGHSVTLIVPASESNHSEDKWLELANFYGLQPTLIFPFGCSARKSIEARPALCMAAALRCNGTDEFSASCFGNARSALRARWPALVSLLPRL